MTGTDRKDTDKVILQALPLHRIAATSNKKNNNGKSQIETFKFGLVQATEKGLKKLVDLSDGDDDDGSDCTNRTSPPPSQPYQHRQLYQSHEDNQKDDQWPVLCTSLSSQRTHNPIRAVVDPILESHRKKNQRNVNQDVTDNEDNPGRGKEFISLALGDPTTSGNFDPCPVMVPRNRANSNDMDIANPVATSKDDAVVTTHALVGGAAVEDDLLDEEDEDFNYNELGMETAGYVNALGTDQARLVIAKFHSAWELHTCHLPLGAQEHKQQRSEQPSQQDECAIQQRQKIPSRVVDSSHVVVASGCSGALDLVLRALLDPGTYLLVPNPGFPLYQVICESMGAHVLPYRLLPERDWEIDLDHVQSLVMASNLPRHLIRGIVVNNPSNPTGAVYSLEHLQDLVALCNHCRLPIVADEIYGDITYQPSRPFIPLANVVAMSTTRRRRRTTGSTSSTTSMSCRTENKSISVPVITCSGLSKQFLVPGWRVGWAIFYDNDQHSLAAIEKGTKALAQITLGASHLAQAMTVRILSSSLSSSFAMKSWREQLKNSLSDNANLLQTILSKAPGLVISKAQGAMYLMVTFDPNEFDFTQRRQEEEEERQENEGSSVDNGQNGTRTTHSTAGEEWSMQLLQEENVFVPPGSCFGLPNAFRLVFCAPKPTLQACAQRIVDFCQRHFVLTGQKTIHPKALSNTSRSMP